MYNFVHRMKKIKKETWVVIGIVVIGGFTGAAYLGVKWLIKKNKESKEKKNSNIDVQNNSPENQ